MSDPSRLSKFFSLFWVILTITIMSGLYRFSYTNGYQQFSVGALDFNKEAFKDVASKYQADQEYVMKISSEVYFASGIIILLLMVLAEPARGRSKAFTGIASLIVLLGICHFAILIWFSVSESRIISELKTSLKKVADSNSAVKTSIEKAYNCKFTEEGKADSCQHFATLSANQFWYAGLFCTLMLNFASSVATTFFALVQE